MITKIIMFVFPPLLSKKKRIMRKKNNNEETSSINKCRCVSQPGPNHQNKRNLALSSSIIHILTKASVTHTHTQSPSAHMNAICDETKGLVITSITTSQTHISNADDPTPTRTQAAHSEVKRRGFFIPPRCIMSSTVV